LHILPQLKLKNRSGIVYAMAQGCISILFQKRLQEALAHANNNQVFLAIPFNTGKTQKSKKLACKNAFH